MTFPEFELLPNPPAGRYEFRKGELVQFHFKVLAEPVVKMDEVLPEVELRKQNETLELLSELMPKPEGGKKKQGISPTRLTSNDYDY